jgi:two-component system, chemotaxis family, sensor kinase CheA
MTAGAMLPEGLESLLDDFVLDARERLETVEQSALELGSGNGGSDASALARLRAELHTIKGNAAMLGCSDLQQRAHALEDVVRGAEVDQVAVLLGVDDLRRALAALAAPRPEAGATPSVSADPSGVIQGGVRVPFAVLDGLVDLLAEMVIQENQLADAVSQKEPLQLARAAEALSRTLDLLRERVMGLRLTPLQTLLGSLRRIVHDECQRSGKSARLETVGGETPLDKALLELAGEALGHLVRNALVHGLETPAIRRAAGKPAEGTVRVSASARGEEVLVEVADDGAGIDPERLRRAAAAKGIELPADADPFDLLFASGFSTAEAVDLSAGRGVGLAAVRSAVQRHGGRIVVRSAIGRGTAFELWLPLTVAISRALLVRADEELYALPLSLVVESRRLAPGDTHEMNHAGVMRWRDEMIALLDLGQHFGTRPGRRSTGYLVVIEALGRRRGLLIDGVQGLQEVVVRTLDPVCGRPVGIAGSTVLGNGRPILILDPRILIDVTPQGGSRS